MGNELSISNIGSITADPFISYGLVYLPQLPPAQPPGNDTLGAWLMRPMGRLGGRGGLEFREFMLRLRHFFKEFATRRYNSPHSSTSSTAAAATPSEPSAGSSRIIR